MRAANSWIQPSAGGGGTSSVLIPPRKNQDGTTQHLTPLSDHRYSQSNASGKLAVSSTSKRLSLASLLVPDKENQTQGHLLLSISPKDTLGVHSSNGGNNDHQSSHCSTSTDCTKPFRESLPVLLHHDCSSSSTTTTNSQSSSARSNQNIWTDIWVDSDNDDDEDDIFLGPTAASFDTHCSKSHNTERKAGFSTTESMLTKEIPVPPTSMHTTRSTGSTAKSNTTGSSAVFQNGKQFWMKFLEQSSEAPSSSSLVTSSQASITVTHDCNNDNPSNRNYIYSPMGRMIQQTFTSGSPLSDASAYGTSETLLEDDTKSTLHPPRSIRAPRTSDADVEDDPSVSPADDVILSRVQAARRRFEQPSQEAILQQEVVRRPLKMNSSTKSEMIFKDPHNETMATTEVITSLGSADTVFENEESFRHTTTLTTGPHSAYCGAVSDRVPVVAIPATSATAYAGNSNQNHHPDRFHSAYQAWQRAGLMKGTVQKSITKVGDQEPAESPQPVALRPAPTSGRRTPGSTMKLKPIESVRPDAAAMVGKNNSGANKQFRSLLTAWQSITNDTADSHFLSPDCCSRIRRETLRPSTTEKLLTTNNKNRISLSGSAISQRIKEFEKDTFDRIREKLLADDENINREQEQSSSIDRSCSIFVEEQSLVESHEANHALTIRENDDLPDMELTTRKQQGLDLNDCTQCECSGSIFSGNDELISFFLPQMGLACTCGKQNPGNYANPDNPTALENVLRPWQVEFLKSFGIYRGEQLVKARHRSAGTLAVALRQWRQKEGMVPFKVSSCSMAIDIWAKTCKIFVRSMRRQQIESEQDLLERRSDEVTKELTHLVGSLPAAPTQRNNFVSHFAIEPESEMEV